MAPGHGLDDFEQAIGANFIGIAQAVAVANLLSTLAIVGKCFRTTDPPAESALGGIVAPTSGFCPMQDGMRSFFSTLLMADFLVQFGDGLRISRGLGNPSTSLFSDAL